MVVKKMATTDHHAQIAHLESALAEARAKTAEDTYHLELLLDAEKASHTETLVRLRLTEERLAASEAERERLRVLLSTAVDPRSVEAVRFLDERGDAIESMLRNDSHAYALADELAQLLLLLGGCPGTVMTPDEYMSADHDDEPTLPMNERVE